MIPIGGWLAPKVDLFPPLGATWWQLGAEIGASKILKCLKKSWRENNI
jgi:hypothetical protein